MHMPGATRTQVSVCLVPYNVHSAYNLVVSKLLRRFYAFLYYIAHFPVLFSSFCSWRCLTGYLPSFLHTVITPRPCSVTFSILTPVPDAVAFETQPMSKARTSLCTQSIYCISFLLHPLRTAPSRFLNTIWVSVPTYSNPLFQAFREHGCLKSSGDDLVSQSVPL